MNFLVPVPQVLQNVNLTGKTAIVTGGNTGIGAQVAKHLYRSGANVIIACRNEAKANKAIELMKTSEAFFPGGQLTYRSLDLSSFENVRQFATTFLESNKHLNILINNAGFIDADGAKSVDGIDMTVAVNHLGPFLLTDLLLNPMRTAFKESNVPTRVVFLSSAAHYSPGSFDLDDVKMEKLTSSLKKYGISKQMNVMTAWSLNQKEKDNGIIALSVHPGFVNSEFGSGFKGILGSLLKATQTMFARKNEDGAATTLLAALAPEIVEKPEYAGAYLDSDGKIKDACKQARDHAACEKLWAASVEICKV